MLVLPISWSPRKLELGNKWAAIVLYHQGCRGQRKISGKGNFFQVTEKSGNFVDGQGSLEREKSGNLKINGYSRQS